MLETQQTTPLGAGPAVLEVLHLSMRYGSTVAVDDVPFTVGNLSGGQRQRLSIALALIGRPRLAILDALTTGVHPSARRDTWHLIEGILADHHVLTALSEHAWKLDPDASVATFEVPNFWGLAKL